MTGLDQRRREPLDELRRELKTRVRHVRVVRICTRADRLADRDDQPDVYLQVTTHDAGPVPEQGPLRIGWNEGYLWRSGPDRGARIGETAAQAADQVARMLAAPQPGGSTGLKEDIDALCLGAIALCTDVPGPVDEIVTAVDHHGPGVVADALTTRINQVLDRLAAGRGCHRDEILDGYLNLLFDEQVGEMRHAVARQLCHKINPQVSAPGEQEVFLRRLLLIHTLAMVAGLGGLPPQPP